MFDTIPLSLLRRGEVASISQLVGDPEEVRRLHELGMCHGARIEILRSGSSCIVRLDGSKICLRNDERVQILVSPRKTG